MKYFDASKTLKWEYGYWAGAVRQWYKEGLKVKQFISDNLGYGDNVRAEVMGYKFSEFVDLEIHRFFTLDGHMHRIPINNFIHPLFEEKILEDHGGWVILRDRYGIVKKVSKDHESLDRYLHSPVSSIKDWQELKETRFNPSLKNRLPGNWDELLTEYKNRTYPLVIGGGQGFFGSPRYLIGDQEILTAFYDKPDLIHAINNDLCDFWINLYDQILDDVKPDMALIWEDMCFKTGPLISPALFREFMFPHYKRLCSFFKERGVDIIQVDTDGNAWKLIPLFIESGVTGLFPMEVAAGMDVLKLREAFPNLQMIGGVDKLVLMGTRQDMDDELDNKIIPAMKQGGFIPTVDHLVPPNVPWDNFVYYRSRLNQAIDDLAKN